MKSAPVRGIGRSLCHEKNQVDVKCEVNEWEGERQEGGGPWHRQSWVGGQIQCSLLSRPWKKGSVVVTYVQALRRKQPHYVVDDAHLHRNGTPFPKRG